MKSSEFKEKIRKRLELKNRGFTLIEIIVVLVIISILMAIAVPNVLGYINRAKETEAEALVRNIYMSATSELAFTTQEADTAGEGADFYLQFLLNEPEHKQHIAEMAGIDPESFEANAFAAWENTIPEVGFTEIYTSNGVIAYVVYRHDTDVFAIYNGVNGTVKITKDIALEDFS